MPLSRPCHTPKVRSVSGTRCSWPSADSRQTSTASAIDDATAQRTPPPSACAPRGNGRPTCGRGTDTHSAYPHNDPVTARDWQPADNSTLDVTELVVGRNAEEGLAGPDAVGLLPNFGAGGKRDGHYGTLAEGDPKGALMARALRTDPDLLLRGEPAAGLDLGGREDLLFRLGELAADPDSPATVLVTHHVEEIPPGFTHAMLMRDGTVVAQGLLETVLTRDNLSKTFGVDLVVRRSGQRYFAYRR